jgi:O-methyltransferase
VYADRGTAGPDSPHIEPRPLAQLAKDAPDLVLIASDADKESLLMAAMPYLTPQAKVRIGGFQHFGFRDEIFERETGNAFAPSFANGYPNSLIHIYQCLKNAALMDLNGVVAEFGMFKGGTTMLMSRFIEALGRDWKVYGFDAFAGVPAPRSPLDMYAHPDCVYLDLATVRRFFEGRNVEIVPGDLVETAQVLAGEDVVLAFVDTDNHTSARCVLDVITDRIVVGGAIVFDHFTGRDRFLYTLGERLAAKRLLDDPRYFNLHDTGVFLRLR